MQPTTEMQFGRDDSPTITIASAFADGQITITVQNQEVLGHACDNELVLAQVIQLRDFLNRHIDSLALTATGADASRSSDDPTSLPAISVIERRLPDLVPAVDAPAGVLHRPASCTWCGAWTRPSASDSTTSIKPTGHPRPSTLAVACQLWRWPSVEIRRGSSTTTALSCRAPL